MFGCLNYCVCADNGKGKGSLNGKAHPKSNAARSFTFRQLATATRNFKATNLIGEGGFGKVYKGRLDTGEASSQALPIFQLVRNTMWFVVLEGSIFVYSFLWMADKQELIECMWLNIWFSEQIVAIKQLNHDGLQGFQEFIVEVLMLSLLHHSNLVTLIGYCTDGDQRLLVYEYMAMGSLEHHLFGIFPDLWMGLSICFHIRVFLIWSISFNFTKIAAFCYNSQMHWLRMFYWNIPFK